MAKFLNRELKGSCFTEIFTVSFFPEGFTIKNNNTNSNNSNNNDKEFI